MSTAEIGEAESSRDGEEKESARSSVGSGPLVGTSAGGSGVFGVERGRQRTAP